MRSRLHFDAISFEIHFLFSRLFRKRIARNID